MVGLKFYLCIYGRQWLGYAAVSHAAPLRLNKHALLGIVRWLVGLYLAGRHCSGESRGLS